MTNLVFLIPEVLSEILEQVDYDDPRPHWLPAPPQQQRQRGPRALTRCLLVNKLWFNEASRILWREVASLSPLARVDNKARQQHYANMIRELTIHYRDKAGERFRLSGLESLVIYCELVEDSLSLLVPTLKHVTISSPSIECIEKLERDCPLVESLQLYFGTLSPQDLEKFKRYLNTVRAVRVETLGIYSDVLLPALARNECVRKLSVPISHTTILSIREEGGMQPFKNLRVLMCVVGCGVRMRDLLQVMPNLECVSIGKGCDHEPIHIRERLNDVLQFASVGLKRISMAAGKTHVKKSLLLALANKFRHLESIQLYSWTPDPNAHNSSENLDDEFAHEFTSRLPNLRALELEFHESLSAEGLISIGKNCPHLELLDLYGDRSRSNPVTWSKRVLFNYPRFCIEKEPLFPRLIFLAPADELQHFPRSMQENHFPRIFYQWEQSARMVTKDTLRDHWRKQQLHFR